MHRKRFATASIFNSVTILSARLSAFALTGYQDSKLPVMTHDSTDTAVSVHCTCASTHLQISIQLSCLVGLRQHFFWAYFLHNAVIFFFKETLTSWHLNLVMFWWQTVLLWNVNAKEMKLLTARPLNPWQDKYSYKMSSLTLTFLSYFLAARAALYLHMEQTD